MGTLTTTSRALTLTRDSDDNPLWRVAGLLLRPLHLGLAFPSVLYVFAMTVFLFRPPDLFSFYADRIAFGILVFFVALRTMALRSKIPFLAGLSLPMLGLLALAVLRALREPFDPQNWSIIASKYIVPFALFHIAVLVFRGASQRRHFEVFVICALAYLVFIAIAFLVDARSLIFPRFILDESLGFHPDRARGPFLQAVANGVSLNILGILVVALPQKGKAVARLLWVVLPLAVLATMTRAVWISFAVSTIALGLRLVERRGQAVCALLTVAGLMVGLAIGLNNHSLKSALWDRTGERGPVEARLAVYEAGWSMFQERPFTGWDAGGMYAELARRMEGYHLRSFYVHNTYLALLVEFGMPGLALYGILFFNLFRLSRHRPPGESSSVASLRKAWPVLLSVYLFNAFFVDMAYQFVIGLVFTIAGMLCASEESAA
ncbi:MAG TPA: O-antigen ligase family protein [Terriglobales bacterium]|jgi:putative inorganic carbon (hco3(-)) transporter|nr:O-antigen ligase family protein [Terriglobales bacterium]